MKRLTARRPRSRIIFVTGTDTGAGKTLLTGLLLHHLRRSGCRALAMKPFCSGGSADVRFLRALQAGELSDREINPFYFPEPVAPLISARKHRRNVKLNDVLGHVRRLAGRCECLLVEGSGGLLVPLGEGFTVASLIKKLDCEVIVAARNQLGVVNHAMLTISELRRLCKPKVKVVLMGQKRRDLSVRSNQMILRELLRAVKVFSVGFLGKNVVRAEVVSSRSKKIKKILARILE
ncbi:MAG TPA: dethiobiotin synthase [Verrucomicrobiae bacterium]|nr:dethiobiotin synthase [Verrucomicrobiae bacterium]